MQKKVEKRMLELADENAKHLGLSRRQFKNFMWYGYRFSSHERDLWWRSF